VSLQASLKLLILISRAIDLVEEDVSDETDSDATSSVSDSDLSDDEKNERFSQEYLNSLLEKALKNAEAAENPSNGLGDSNNGDEVITLDDETPMWFSFYYG